MMKKLMDGVRYCTSMELKMANKNYPLFTSDHEGIAVIEEEVFEANNALTEVYGAFNSLKIDMVFDDHSDEEKKTVANALQRAAQELACESIQIAAMAQKFVDSIAHRNEEHIPEFTPDYADYLAENFCLEKPSWIKDTPIIRRLKEEE